MLVMNWKLSPPSECRKSLLYCYCGFFFAVICFIISCGVDVIRQLIWFLFLHLPKTAGSGRRLMVSMRPFGSNLHIFKAFASIQHESLLRSCSHCHFKTHETRNYKKPLQKHNLNLILASLSPCDFLSWTKLPAVFGSFVSICISIAHCIPFVVIIKFVVISFSFFVFSFFSFVLCKASMYARSSHRIRLPCPHFPFCCFLGKWQHFSV